MDCGHPKAADSKVAKKNKQQAKTVRPSPEPTPVPSERPDFPAAAEIQPPPTSVAPRRGPIVSPLVRPVPRAMQGSLRHGTSAVAERFEEPIPILIWIFVAAALLFRGPLLVRYGLWLDEIAVKRVIEGPLPAMLRTLHFVHFLAIKPFLAISGNRFFLRLPSLLFGAALIPLGYLAARRLFDSTTALLFAGFLTFGTYFINYSVDANYYSHMMFWSLAGLYCFARMKSTGRLRNILPILGIAPLCFYVHPFSAFYFAALAAVIVAELVLTEVYLLRLPGFGLDLGSRSRRLGFVTVVLGGLLLAALMLAAMTGAGKGIIRMAGTFLDMLSPGSAPSNVKLSIGFFQDYFVRIGPGVREIGTLASSVSPVLFLFFAAGIAGSGRRDPILPALLIVPFIVTFILIFNLGSGHFFHIRYISYLVPLYWLGIAAGTVHLGTLILRWTQLPRACQGAMLIPCVLLAFCWLPQYRVMLTSDFYNWDEVIPKAAARAVKGEPFVYSNETEGELLNYYLKKYGLGDHPRLQLDYVAGRDRMVEEELKNACERTPSLFFVSGWLDRFSPLALGWARRRMDTVATGRTGFLDVGPFEISNVGDTAVFHWDMGDRYVRAPRSLEFAPASGKGEPVRQFTEKFLIDQTLAYETRLTLRGKAADEDVTLSWDGRVAPVHVIQASDGESHLRATADLEEGPHELSIVMPSHQMAIDAVQIIPRYPGGKIVVPAVAPSRHLPTRYISSPILAGENALRFERKAYSQYEVTIADEGKFWLAVEGAQTSAKKVTPVWFEVLIDGVPVGILQFGNGPDHWELHGFPVRLPAGNHLITLQFLNEWIIADLNSEKNGMERHALLHQLELHPIGDDEKPGDDRVFGPGRQPIPVRIAEPGGTRLADGWDCFVLGEKQEYEILSVGEGREPVFKMTFNRDSAGVSLVSPMIPIPASNIIYYSAYLRTDHLKNHSANILTEFYDDQRKKIGEMGGYQEGLEGTNDWERMVELRKIVSKAKSYRIMFWVYPHGTSTTNEKGVAYFTRPRLEAN